MCNNWGLMGNDLGKNLSAGWNMRISSKQSLLRQLIKRRPRSIGSRLFVNGLRKSESLQQRLLIGLMPVFGRCLQIRVQRLLGK